MPGRRRPPPARTRRTRLVGAPPRHTEHGRDDVGHLAGPAAGPARAGSPPRPRRHRRSAGAARRRPPRTSTTSPRTSRSANTRPPRPAGPARPPRGASSARAPRRPGAPRRPLAARRAWRRRVPAPRAAPRCARRQSGATRSPAFAPFAGQEALDTEPIGREPAHGPARPPPRRGRARCSRSRPGGQPRPPAGAGVRDAGRPGVAHHRHGRPASHGRRRPGDPGGLVVPVQR